MPANDASGYIVSQQELDTLGATLDEHVRHNESAGVEITLYDFRRAHRLSAAQVRQIENDCDCIGSALNRTLHAYLDGAVEVGFITVDRMSSRQYLCSLPDDAVLASFCSLADGPEMLIHLDRPLVWSALDMMLGGTGQEPDIPERAMSQVEVQLFRSLIEEIITVAKMTAKCLKTAPVEIREVYLSPIAVDTVENDEWLVCASYRLRFGSHEGYMTLGLPSSSMHRLLTHGDESNLSDDEAGKAVLTSVALCPVGVRAVVARSRLSLGQMSRLAIGDVIDLHLPPSQAKSVEIVIGGKQKFTAIPGVQDGQSAVRIVDKAGHPHHAA